MKTIEDHLAQVDKPVGGCWLWRGAKNGAGRASFRGLSAPRKTYEHVHQCSVLPQYGVLHSCDNPMCVNPDHLRIGTQKENMCECSMKGRRSPNSKQKPGEAHSMAKLTWADVRQIREIAKDGVKHEEIATRYRVQRRQISRIISGQRWREDAAAAA
jgi:hypothetical protein